MLAHKIAHGYHVTHGKKSIISIKDTFASLHAELDRRREAMLLAIEHEENNKLNALRLQQGACAKLLATVRATMEESLRVLERDDFGLLDAVKATMGRVSRASDDYGDLEMLEPIVDGVVQFKCDRRDLVERIEGLAM